MNDTTSTRRRKVQRAAALVGSVALAVGGLQLSDAAGAATGVPGKVSGAVYTTNVDGSIVNQNQYALKTDVYLSGGPQTANAHFLEAGDYFFAILNPGGQSDPNDGGLGNLSDGAALDTAADRTFHSDGTAVYTPTTYSTHDFSLAGLVQAAPFDDTSNPGGVYIAAVCQFVADGDGNALPVDPRDCKYDAFKVKKDVPPPPVTGQSAPTAEKSAVPTHTRTINWTIAKTADGASSQSYLGSPRTVAYVVTATKTATDTFGLTGTITVFNTNTTPLDVTVTEDGLVPSAGETCALTGSGALTVPAKSGLGDPGQAAVDYACSVPTAPADGQDYTNTATVLYDLADDTAGQLSLPVASDPFAFPAATLTAGSEPETINVTDAFNGGAATALTPATANDSYTWSYTRTLANSNCVTYPNTAAITQTTDTASASVQLCGPNSGGLTQGWWQNKNGQALLKNNITAACATVNGYLPAAFTAGATTYLPDAYTAGTKYKPYLSAECTTPGTTSYLPAYDLNVFSVGAASGTGTKMVLSQWLTAAMDTAPHTLSTSAGKPTLSAGTKVVVPAALQSGLGLAACSTIGDLLTQSAGQYACYATAKTAVTSALIPLLTSINENKAQTCP